MRPGKNLIIALSGACAMALLAPWLWFAAWIAAATAAITLVAAALEWVLLARLRFKAERPRITALSLGEAEAIEVALSSNARQELSIRLRQVWPRVLLQRASAMNGYSRPGELLRLRFPIQSVERGRDTIAPPTAAVTMWGLCERIAAVGAPQEINVLPNLRAVRRLHAQLNRFALRGLGTRAAPKLGKGRGFDRLREYHNDDDFRDIAWKASARHNKLIVREFRTDRSQDVLVCLDRGHRMAARTEQLSKVDHAVNSAVLLAYICNRMEDRMGLLSFGAEVERGVGQGRGMGHMRHLTAFATGIRAEYVHTDYLALAAHVRRRLRHRSLVLIMTDLPEATSRAPLLKAVRLLLPQHLPLVVVLSDPALEASANFRPANKRELCRTLVAHDVWQERRQMLADLQRMGALVVDTTPQDAGIAAINAYIDVKRRQLL